MTLKQKRVNSSIMRIVSDIIEKEVKDPRIGFVTVNAVESTADLKHATVYFTVHGDEKEGQLNSKILNHASGFIQHKLSNRVKLRHTPKLTFEYSPIAKKRKKIEELLNKDEEE